MVFTIEGVSEQTPPPSPNTMRGPMLQTLLEEQFTLKMHRESREVPVYEMVVAKSGAKVKPLPPDSCVASDWSVSPQPPLEPGQRRCRNISAERDPTGTAFVQTVEAMMLDELAAGMTKAHWRWRRQGSVMGGRSSTGPASAGSCRSAWSTPTMIQ